ncbi:MAG: LysR family transcriptional regulator [Deltaproteobacteria bacterium]|nr:LysR family transcriptional regulator [Deltaproteobacteria bacterium]
MRIRMDWRSIRFDWNRARAFLVTAEEGSLSAASRALGMTQPTLGRQVSALEEELDVVLFERSGRGLLLTPSGLELLEHVRSMGDAANRISLSAVGQSQSIEGEICITASDVQAAFMLPEVIKKLRRLEPGIHVEIIAKNSASDLGRREADIAIRSFRPTQPTLVAKKVKDLNARLYGSPEYLKSLGDLVKPSDLAKADFIGIDLGSAFMDALNHMGLELTERNFPVISENLLVMWELVKAGVGIGIIQDDVGDTEPRVVRVLEEFPPMAFPMWLVARREIAHSRRIRRVFDFLAAELSGGSSSS